MDFRYRGARRPKTACRMQRIRKLEESDRPPEKIAAENHGSTETPEMEHTEGIRFAGPDPRPPVVDPYRFGEANEWD